MTNIYNTPEKQPIGRRLFDIGIEALEKQGYEVHRVPGGGKSSLRRITKDGASDFVLIRTTQDQWFAFPKTPDGKWLTLDDTAATTVVVVALDSRETGKARNGLVHRFPVEEVRDRLDRAYSARIAAGHTIPTGRGVWISLYTPEAKDPVNLVGAGIGLVKEWRLPNIPLGLEVELDPEPTTPAPAAALAVEPAPTPELRDDGPLTIAEAKRRLALTFGVDPSAIKITVEG